MSAPTSKPVRSPSYPTLSLRDAIGAVRKIETRYRTSAVDRTDGARLIGYSSLSGPANQALASLANYGLVERAGKGLIKVTSRAVSILHPNNKEEAKKHIREAGLEPSLFQELRERFAGVDFPPEEGIVSYLNRQGFNQSAVRPAVRAFLETLSYLDEAGVNERADSVSTHEQDLRSQDELGPPQFGGAKVGDLIQWESEGTLRLSKPEKVRWISEDGNWVALANDEYKAAIPMAEVIVQEATPNSSAAPPIPPAFVESSPSHVDALNPSKGTEFRFGVGKGVVVRVSSHEDLGVEEINKLIALLQAQAIALS